MRILYRNAIDNYTLTANQEASGYPVTNLQDPTLAAKWRTPTFTDLIDRGDCESTTPPMVTGETVPDLTNATFVRDGTEKFEGTYSYLCTKNVAAGTGATINLCDNKTTTDMHGLTAGKTYAFMLRIFIPSAGGVAVNFAKLRMADYVGSYAFTEGLATKIDDSWQEIFVIRTLRTTATGVYFWININSLAENAEIFYVDKVQLFEVPQIQIDAGTDNVISAKSFAIGGHNLTGGVKITIEGNDSVDFDSPDYSDELTRNLIIDPEDFTTSNWLVSVTNKELTNMYVNNKRLNKCTLTASSTGSIRQLQSPANITQSFQAIIREGTSASVALRYLQAAAPNTVYGEIIITWATQTITGGEGLTNLEYDWIDDNTAWVSGTANSIDTSVINALALYPDLSATSGQYAYATAMMVEDNPTVTHYDEIHADPRVSFYSEQSFRYWQILIEDFDNLDIYIEMGRMHHGDYLGLADIIYREFPIELASTSDKRYTVTGQLYGDQGIIQRLYNFQLPHLTDSQRQMIENMFFYSDIILPVFLIINDDDFSKLKPLYASINDDLNHNHIFNFLYNNTLSFKEAK